MPKYLIELLIKFDEWIIFILHSGSIWTNLNDVPQTDALL
jgi:hypothetical protein